MLKVYSSCLLLTTLAFSSAQAPTFQLWRNLPIASADETLTQAQVTNGFDSHAGMLAYADYALTHEYEAGNDLESFELDELLLPKLNVDLPELFDWSDGQRTYLASNVSPSTFGFDHPTSFAFHRPSASGGFGSGGIAHAAGLAGGNAKNANRASGSDLQSTVGQEDNAAHTVAPQDSADVASSQPTSNENASTNSGGPTGDSDDEQLAQNPTHESYPPIASLIPSVPDQPGRPDSVVEATKPVQVPVPATFGLFALGLAALRLVGRKKNGSG